MFRILLLLLVFSLDSSVLADGKFCYRESGGMLTCHDNMERIPEEFQRKAFFVSSDIDSSTSSSGMRDSRSSLGSEEYEIVSPPSDTRLIPRRDPPLSAERGRKVPMVSTDKKLSGDAKLPSIHEHDSTRTSISHDQSSGREQPAPQVIVNDPLVVAPVHDSGLPPAKGYKPEKSLPGTATHNSSHQEILKTEEIKPRAVAKPIEVPVQDTARKTDSPLVQIFVADWCTHCKALENFLIQEKISFQKYDVEKDPNAIKLYEEHGSIPISRIGNSTVVGFEAERYRALIDANLPY